MKNLCKWMALCLVAALLCGVLAGCEEKKAESTAEPDYSALTVPPVDVTITDCVDEKQLQTILGFPVVQSGIYEDGTQAVYMTEDGACQVTVGMINQTREGFDATVASCDTEMVRQEGLGEAAYWLGKPEEFKKAGQIMVYSGGYALEVGLSSQEIQQPQTYIQQIVEMVLRRLPTAPAQ